MNFSPTCYGKIVPELDYYFHTLKGPSDIHKYHSEKNKIEVNSEPGNEVEDLLQLDTPAGKLTKYFYKHSHTDLKIILSKSDETYEVHKLVLKMTSCIFEELISKEGNELILNDEPDSFKWILLHAYLGYSEIPSKLPDLIDLYKTLRKYCIIEISVKCAMCITKYIKIETLNDIYDIGCKYNDDIIIDACVKMIKRSGKDLLALVEKGKLSSGVVITFLSEDSLQIPEIKLFSAIVAWAKLKIITEEKCVDLRSHLQPFLYEIDFLCMQPEDIITTVAEESIFTEEEVIGILMTQSNSKNDSLSHDLNKSSSYSVHQCYPSFLRKKSKHRRLNFPEHHLRSCQISSYGKCEYKSRWLTGGTYDLLVLQSSENVFLSQIRARSDCFLGDSYLDIKDTDISKCLSSKSGPPWLFNPPVEIRKGVSYIVMVNGKGRICQHEMKMFSIKHFNIEFCGESIICDISFKYLK